MSPVTFSIIVPTLNSGSSISFAIESILNQTFQAFEIIIVDGLSVDDTLNIAMRFGDERIKVVSQKDKGIYDAMNKGIEIANGEYLYFMGSDDTFYGSNVLNNIKERLATANPRVLYGNVRMRGSNQWVPDGLIHAGEFNLKRLLSHNISHQAIFYHRSVFNELGKFNIKYPIFADYDMNLRCFASYPFVYIDEIVANFKVGGASSGSTDEAFEHDKLKNIIRYFSEKIFTREFVDCRLFVQRAAFSNKSGIGLSTRLFCMLAYFKLKTLSFFQ